MQNLSIYTGQDFNSFSLKYMILLNIPKPITFTHGLHKGMKALLTLNKLSIQNSKRWKDLIPLEERKKTDGKTEISYRKMQLNRICNKQHCFTVPYVLPVMSLKNWILSFLHKISENGFVFLTSLWGDMVKLTLLERFTWIFIRWMRDCRACSRSPILLRMK